MKVPLVEYFLLPTSYTILLTLGRRISQTPRNFCESKAVVSNKTDACKIPEGDGIISPPTAMPCHDD